MNTRLSHTRRGKDYASEELISALLAKPTYTFNELFEAVDERLTARKVSSVGEEMLRLRVYERLQTFVGRGWVKKAGKEYTAVRSAVQAQAAELEANKAYKEKRKRETAPAG